jgi:MFS family permease
MENLLRSNIKKIQIMGFFQAFTPVVPIFVPLVQANDLSMMQIMQAQAVFAFTIAMAEVPSGYLADNWGRRNTLILGSVLLAIGWIWFCFATSFSGLIVYEVLMGIALSLFSGTDLAMLYDSQAEINKTSRHGGAVDSSASKLVSIKAFAEAAGAFGASILMVFSIAWVAPIQAVTAIVPLLIALSLVEPMRESSLVSHKDNLHNMVRAVTNSPIVMWTIAAIISFGLATIVGFWTLQKYWQHNDIAIENYGYIWAFYCLIVSLSARGAVNAERKLGVKNLLLLMIVFAIAAFVGMALSSGWIGILVGGLFQVSRGFYHVVFFDALNRRLANEYRATINSITSLGIRAIFIVCGPALGFVIDQYGIIVALWVIVGLFTPTLGIILVILSRCISNGDKKDTTPALATR